jgi:hypothetical protein
MDCTPLSLQGKRGAAELPSRTTRRAQGKRGAEERGARSAVHGVEPNSAASYFVDAGILVLLRATLAHHLRASLVVTKKLVEPEKLRRIYGFTSKLG